MIKRREFLQSAVALACTTPMLGTIAAAKNGPSQLNFHPDTTVSLKKLDRRREPFRIAVALGDSITAGWGATSREFCWVSRMADSVNESQLQPVKMINAGIGANVISPRSSGYDASGKPSAMERYEKHVVAHQPDLVTIAYGVNDARAGTPVGQFLEDLRHIVTATKSKTEALVVVLSTDFMTAFNRYPPFNRANPAVFESYNAGMHHLSEECDVLYADIFSALAFAPWTVDPLDGVHPNNLGHKLIADCVFTVLAQSCSCLSQKALELRKSAKPWQNMSALQEAK